MTREESAILNIQTGFAGTEEIDLINQLYYSKIESNSLFESLITLLKKDGINSKRNAIILINAHLQKQNKTYSYYKVGKPNVR